MKHSVLRLLPWLIGVGILVAFFAKSILPVKESIVGLTYKAREVECKTKKNTRCDEPDPAGVVFELKLPAGVRADDRRTRYEHGIRLSMIITSTSITPMSKWIDRQEVMNKNYALGVHGNVKLFARNPDEEFESILLEGLGSASIYAPDDYHKYSEMSSSYFVYDSDECKGLLPSDLHPSKSALHLNCYSKRILYEPKEYEWAYAICPRKFMGADGEVSIPVCVVLSRIDPGVFMRYHINGEYIDDRSWVDYDKRIRNYIVGLKAR